ncbi:hypothetical protein Tco_1500976 [Tanacetum coccineum]
MSSSPHSTVVPSDSDNENTFSSTNILNYFPASPGNISPNSSDDFTKYLLDILLFPPLHDDPYIQAYDVIPPSQVIIALPAIVPPSMSDSRDFFPPKEISSPEGAKTPVKSPNPMSTSSSVGSSSPVRSTTSPPNYLFNESIFAELDNSLWIISRPLGSKPVPEEFNMPPKRTSTSAAPAMTQDAIQQLVADSVAIALKAQAANLANTDNTNKNIETSETPIARKVKPALCNGCMLFDNHDLCVLDFINNVNARVKSKSIKKSSKRKVWKPTGKVFINIGDIWRPTGWTFTIVDLSKSKVLKSVSANKKEPNQSWGSNVSDVPSSSLDECRYDGILSYMSLVKGLKGLSPGLAPRRIIETIHVDFDELTAMASEHSSSRPALHEITPVIISLGLMPNPPPSTPFVPPSRTPEVIALIAEVVAPEPAASTGSPSSTTVDQDAPSPNSDASYLDVIPTVVHIATPNLT